jgi:hypothetical protein
LIVREQISIIIVEMFPKRSKCSFQHFEKDMLEEILI